MKNASQDLKYEIENDGDKSLDDIEFNQESQDQFDDLFDGLPNKEDLSQRKESTKDIIRKIRKVTSVNANRGTFVGTPLYITPEMLYQ